MKEHPILFSAPMVNAILDGRKTQTRRVVTAHTSECSSVRWELLDIARAIRGRDGWGLVAPVVPDDTSTHRIRPRWKVGDGLWVRETWGMVSDNFGVPFYRADGAHLDYWTPSIHMPRWASRIDLEVVSVRVERLQDITEEDARAEGLALERLIEPGHAAGCFANLWDAINAKRGYPWSSNPWVWRLEFKRLRP